MIAELVLLSAATLGPLIPVDFQLSGSNSANPTPVSPRSAPVAATGQRPVQPAIKVIIARGFGHDVPLAFAVRQVVPHYMHVSFGGTVDQQAHVSWQGGKPWRQVLRAAVKPLGLHVVMEEKTLRITE